MHFTCRSFIGTQNTGDWSQYWENEPDDPVLFQKKGHLFGLISINQESQDSDVSTIGRDIIFEINQNYYSSSEDNPTLGIKNTLSAVIDNPLYHHLDSINILIAVVLNDRIHFSGIGNFRVILCRGNQLGQVFGTDKSEISIIEGPVVSEDRIMLMTEEFFNKIGNLNIKKYLSISKIQALEENIMSGIYACEDQTGMASALIIPHTDTEAVNSFQDDDVTEVEQTIPASPISDIGSIKKNFISKLFSIKPVFVSKCEINQISRRRKANLIVVVLLLVALSISSYLGYKKNNNQKKENQYQQMKTDLDDKIANALAVKNLNLDSALQLAKESENIWQKMKALGVHTDEISVFEKNINALLSQTGSSDTPQLDVFYDTALISGGKRKYSSLTAKSNVIYLLDSETGHVDSVDTVSKSIKSVSANEKNKDGQKIMVGTDNFYINKADGIYLINKNSTEKKIDFSDINNIEVIDVAFWNGSFYVLDDKSDNILKFTPNATGFGSPQKWLKDGEKMADNATSFAINGKVWVLTSEGKITPFLRGEAQTFQPGQNISATQANHLVTIPEKDILAFVDVDNMVYVYKNNGETLSRFSLGQVKSKQIVIDNQVTSIYILGSDQKIYKINL